MDLSGSQRKKVDPAAGSACTNKIPRSNASPQLTGEELLHKFETVSISTKLANAVLAKNVKKSIPNFVKN